MTIPLPAWCIHLLSSSSHHEMIVWSIPLLALPPTADDRKLALYHGGLGLLKMCSCNTNSNDFACFQYCLMFSSSVTLDQVQMKKAEQNTCLSQHRLLHRSRQLISPPRVHCKGLMVRLIFHPSIHPSIHFCFSFSGGAEAYPKGESFEIVKNIMKIKFYSF